MATVNVDDTDTQLNEAISSLNFRSSKRIDLLKEQDLAIKCLLKEKDVLAVLPTGFGKSLVFQVFAVVKSLDSASWNGCVLVICLLKSIIADQIEEASSLGLTAVELESLDMFENLPRLPDILFALAEAVCADGFRDALKKRQDIHLVVVDESHTIETWAGERDRKGKVFRSAYGELAVLRSFCTKGTPYLALTGTADESTQTSIIKSLGMVNPEKIVMSPERKNLRITVVKCKKAEMFSKLDWLVEMVRQKGINTPKTMIFCNMMSDMANVANYLLFKLGCEAYNSKTADMKDCLIDIFHSMTWTESKDKFLASFKKADSVKRIVVASTALSMGVNFPDVKYVVNWGPARTLLDYHQEAGRAGRDESPAHSIIIYHGNQTAQCEVDVKNFVRTSECYRVASLKPFVDDVKPLQPGHDCCSNCAVTCKCGGSCSALPFENPVLIRQQQVLIQRKRDVMQQQRINLKEALTEMKEKFSTRCSLEVHGFSDDLVKQLVEGACTIFAIKDILCFPVFSVKVATQILEIFQDIFHDIEEMDDIANVFFRDRATDIYFLVTDDEDCTGEYFDDGEEVNETW